MKVNKNINIAASILSADFSHLGEQVTEAEQAGASCIHIDVMDGQFVNPITFGPLIVGAIRDLVSIPLEIHMMTLQPEKHLAQLVESGANRVIVHVEACPHVHGIVHLIKDSGLEVGVAVNPGTSLTTIEHILPDINQLLIMTVNPGYGGQAFIANSLRKIDLARKMIDAVDDSITLEVDGGINAKTAHGSVNAGANLLVAGSAVFNSESTVQSAISTLNFAINTPTSQIDN